jgi:alkanesulfonate monooxygenase SsuD/methylene tetrahydromethanopterin reductase-like flavin-dependent oxidoreductase (luciferase family)
MTHSPTEALDTARWADANGWYGVWYADHYMPNTGSEQIAPGDTYECWAMLPAIAMATERVRVGSLVTPTSVHHPAVLANRASTIDHISNGRMVLGLGAGWQINEHKAYGIELEPPGKRVQRFDEAIQIIRSLLTNERTTFEGRVYSITAATADPKPVQSPLPLLVGTGSARMLRITATHADEWNTWGNPTMAAERRQRFLAACEEVGRDPGSMHTSVQALLYVTDSPEVIERTRTGPYGERAVPGSANQILDAVGRYAELGFDEFIVPDFNLGTTASQRREALQQIHEEIVSRL